MVRYVAVLPAEKITDPFVQDAAGTPAVLGEITGLIAPVAAGPGVVLSAASGTKVAAVICAADHDALISA
ncbi:hypothetical protein (plasmid) [Streptomyces leeuwenhoekii]|uniref:Uncharacterized protein n=1 Tax=Streptomyces leeuwenhoekii TaxID=1437453 RepID=A0A0F7VQ11_STRLW|nr:hypothetical protein [Streptomyces leeuwenhoekii]